MLNHLKKRRTVYFLMIMSLIGYFSKYGLNVLLSHHLSPRRFGEFSIAIRVLGILSSVALLGTNVSARRFLSRFLQLNDEHSTKFYLQWNMRLIHSTFLLSVILGLTTYITMHLLHIWHFRNIQNYHMVIYMLWVAPIAALVALLDSYLLCADHTALSNFLNNIKTAFYILVFFVFFIFFKAEVHVFMISVVLFVALSILLLIEVYFITYKTPLLSQQILFALGAKEAPKVDDSWLGVSLRLALNNLMFLIVCTGDLFLVQFINPTGDAVAKYAVVLTIASALFVIPQNIYTAIKGKVSSLIDTKKGCAILEEEIKSLNRYSLAVILLIGLGIIYFSSDLLGHFGRLYKEAEIPLLIVTFGFMIGAYAQGGIVLIAYSGNEKVATNVSLIELITLIVSGVILTYMYGILGTAFATSLAIITKTILFHIHCYRKLGIHSFAI
ncbi:MAG: hypothetical protein A3F18_00645 [Legionellales bacterium RIFCSPHIGHO2_12_FULL_37_14]|nr:MAG: hypothetical protein A3F18_00645 [Legionellales bacterium RIFCSPHIGHO2_12_FULL_37_14]